MKEKRTEKQQADFSAAQIICPPKDGGNNSPEMKAFAKQGGYKNGKQPKIRFNECWRFEIGIMSWIWSKQYWCD